MSSVLGIDISANQAHPIEFQQLYAAGVRAIYVKATEGLGYVNPDFEGDAQEAAIAGCKVGAYHFARPAESDAASQAQAFVAATAPVRGALTLPDTLDLEDQGGLGWGTLAAWAQAWLGPPLPPRMIYLSGWFRQSLPGVPWGHHLWLAAPGAPQVIPAGCSAVQFSWTGTLPGIPGGVEDLDRFDASLLGPPQEDAVPDLIVDYEGGAWLVRADFSCRTGLSSAADRDVAIVAGAATGHALTPAQMHRIPVAGRGLEPVKK